MEERSEGDESQRRRELLARAAEKRFQATNSTLSETQSQSQSEDIDLSQSLFSGYVMSIAKL